MSSIIIVVQVHFENNALVGQAGVLVPGDIVQLE